MPAPIASKFIETWYESQCNGVWEHANGVTIETLANAGWLVTIDLQETPLEARPMREISAQRSDTDWMICKVEHSQFRGEGDPKKLSAILRVFETWASQTPR
jgi:hypothetical protein